MIHADINRLPGCAAGIVTGKALDVNTPILTASGWKTMSSIEVGDVVFNEWAEHVTVTDVFDVQFDRPCFEG